MLAFEAVASCRLDIPKSYKCGLPEGLSVLQTMRELEI